MNRAGLLKSVVVALDAVAVAVGLWAAHLTWTWWRPHLEFVLHIEWHELWGNNPFMPPGLVLVAMWFIAMRRAGLYDPGRMTSGPRIAAGVTRAAAVVPVAAMTLQFLLPDRTYSRFLVLAFCGWSALALMVLRLGFFRIQRHVPRPITQRRVAVVGIEADAMRMAERMARYGHHNWRLVGFLRPADSDDAAIAVPPARVLGGVQDIAALVNQHDIHVLILATRGIHRDDALILATRADQMGLQLLQVPLNWGLLSSARVGVASMGDLQMIDLTSMAYPTLAAQFKRGLDLALVSVGGALLLPFVALIALAIKLQDGGPVMFTQPRAGKGGRRFPFFKFRSMVVDAEAQREDLAALNEADGVLFKMRHDPRITPLGHFLRKYSLDELPQLWNVMRGDMNLVGPRPLPMSDLAGIERDPELEYWFEMRGKVKPGITGPWQVSGRSDAGFEEMVQHDIDYIQSWNLWADLLILARTIPAVLRGRGAR